MGQVRSFTAWDRPKTVVRWKSKPEKLKVARKKLKQGSDGSKLGKSIKI